MLPLPEGVQVVHAVPAVGHLSSSSIYPACLAPYCIVTACSDKTIRFWRAKMSSYSAEENSPNFEWEECKASTLKYIVLFSKLYDRHSLKTFIFKNIFLIFWSNKRNFSRIYAQYLNDMCSKNVSYCQGWENILVLVSF